MKKSDVTRRVHVILPAATYNKLKAECARTGATMTVVIIRALEAKGK